MTTGPFSFKAIRPTPATFLLVGFFFFNTLLLPHGLLYTTLLTPLFLWQVLRRGYWKPVGWYAILSVLTGGYHLWRGAQSGAYLKSWVLFTSVFVFILWAVVFIQKHKAELSGYFRQIALYNTLFLLLAIPVLFVPGLNQWLWSFEPIHPALPVVPRLKLWVYEPSFYALQLAPVFLFYFVSFLFFTSEKYLPGLLALGAALLAAFSFGVLGGLLVAVLLILLLHLPVLFRRRRLFFMTFYLLALVGLAALLLWQFFPLNPVFERIEKLLAGLDTSANGRTWEAFLLAWRILEETDYLLGAGLGQVKVVGHDIIINYYQYIGEWTERVRIPNAMAETLATFGLAGVAVRIFAEVGLFFYTRANENYYRMMLFAFLFLYQFTGSYLTNIYEYLAWALVFLPVFPQLNKSKM